MLQPEQVMPCGVLIPGSPVPKRGVSHRDRPYGVEMSGHLHLSREEAVAFGKLSLQQGHFRHVLGEQDYFYRCGQDGDPEERNLSK